MATWHEVLQQQLYQIVDVSCGKCNKIDWSMPLHTQAIRRSGRHHDMPDRSKNTYTISNLTFPHDFCTPGLHYVIIYLYNPLHVIMILKNVPLEPAIICTGSNLTDDLMLVPQQTMAVYLVPLSCSSLSKAQAKQPMMMGLLSPTRIPQHANLSHQYMCWCVAATIKAHAT